MQITQNEIPGNSVFIRIEYRSRRNWLGFNETNGLVSIWKQTNIQV